MHFNDYPKDFLIEDIILTDVHLKVINLLRNFYQEFNIIPSTRAIINYASNKAPDLNLDSLLFVELFPKGITQACKIANLPESPRCL